MHVSPARAGLAAVFALAAFLLFFRLGDRAFRNPDEGRYASISAAMARDGRWLHPQIFGQPYLRKPPLFYWLVGGSFRGFGESEASARLVPALFALLGIGAAYGFARRAFGSGAALTVAAMLATHFWYVQIGRFLVIDMPFAALAFAASCAYYFAVTGPPRQGARTDSSASFDAARRGWSAAFYLFAALATLTKGPAGLTLPLAGALAWAAIERDASVLKPLAWVPGWALFLGIAGVPLWLLERAEPGFFNMLIDEHAGRFSSAFEHQRPWFYYAPLVVAIFLPWSLFGKPAALAFRAARSGPDARALRFAAAHALAIFATISVVRTKLPTYILPVVPFLAILLAYGWEAWRREYEGRSASGTDSSAPGRCGESLGKGAQIASLALVFVGAFLLLVTPKAIALFARRFQPEIVDALRPPAAALVAGGVMAFRASGRGRPIFVFSALVITLAVVNPLFSSALAAVNRDYSTQALSAALRPRLGPEDLVFVYGEPSAFYDAGFYVGPRVRAAGREGEFEDATPDAVRSRPVLSPAEAARFHEPGRRAFWFMKRSDFGEIDPRTRAGFTIIEEDRRKILFEAP